MKESNIIPRLLPVWADFVWTHITLKSLLKRTVGSRLVNSLFKLHNHGI